MFELEGKIKNEKICPPTAKRHQYRIYIGAINGAGNTRVWAGPVPSFANSLLYIAIHSLQL